MVSPQSLVFILIGATIALIVAILARPAIALSRGGRLFAFLAFFILPVTAASIGASEHFERSKQTQFCLSCHIMEPWGKSLHVDDLSHIPAAHFQNHRI